MSILLIPFTLRFFWVLTANDLFEVPEPIIDRTLVFNIPAPKGRMLETVIRNLFNETVSQFNGHGFTASDEVIAQLCRHNPRTIKRLLNLALAYAADAGRSNLDLSDIAHAERLGKQKTASARIGFLQHRSDTMPGV